MFIINSANVIQLTRGDTAQFSVSITDSDGDEYIPSENEKLIFRLKKQAKDGLEILIEKNAVISTCTFELEEADTKELAFGSYVYEIELVTESNKHYTIITSTKFIIGEELENHD